MTEHFCTYFNADYLVRGLALYQSLKARYTAQFTLWVLCLDDQTYTVLKSLAASDLRPIRLSEIESADSALLQAKQNRSTIEYYFTCSPAWTLYLLDHYPEIERLTYLDSDMYFFSTPQPVFDELGGASIGIIAHKFPAHLQHLEIYGRYNVGWLTFRRDENALTCLRWWRERCIEWCYDRLEGDKFADQKYLDQWQTRFEGVKTIEHKGANTAPWNWMQYNIQITDGGLKVDDQPLIFFHYQGLKLLSDWIYDPGYWQYQESRLPAQKLIYPRYIDGLRHAKTWLRTVSADTPIGYTGVRSRAYNRKGLLLRLMRNQLVLLFPPL